MWENYIAMLNKTRTKLISYPVSLVHNFDFLQFINYISASTKEFFFQKKMHINSKKSVLTYE